VGPFYKDYPLTPNFYAFGEPSGTLSDPFLQEHLDKITDEETKAKIDY
jgi:hypothetical protein